MAAEQTVGQWLGQRRVDVGKGRGQVLTEVGARRGDEVVLERPLPDAVACHDDAAAFGVYRGLREVAPEAVDQVRVVSFDDVGSAAPRRRPLIARRAQGCSV